MGKRHLAGEKSNRRPSLAFRLALTLVAVVAACQVVTFFIVYAVMASTLQSAVDLRLQHEVSEVTALFSPQGVGSIQEALTRIAHTEGTDLALYRLMDARGVTLAESDATAWRGLTIDPAGLASARNGRPFFATANEFTDSDQARVLYAPLSEGTVLQVALRTVNELRPLRNLRQLFLTVGIAGLCGSILVAWTVARKALAPLRTMTGTAITIAEGNLGARVTTASRDAELDRLAAAFNVMLDRIQAFVRELRDMNDSLAHDLRSVLARIQLAADRILTSRPISEEQELLAVSIVAESTELLGLLNTIMDLSELNTGITQTKFAPVDVSQLVRELCDFFEVTTMEKGVTMDVQAPGGAIILGDRGRLRRAVANLIDNAVKYTNPGGRIHASVRVEANGVAVCVSDSGIGIPPTAQPFIFDRFFRVDASRSSDGHGLGLSLTSAIVQLHGGTIHVESEEGKGTAFTLQFPCRALVPE